MTTLHDQILADQAYVIEATGILVLFDFGTEKREVAALFDDGYQQALLGDIGAASSQPTLLVMTDRVVDRIEPGEVGETGTTVVVDGERYVVTHHKPDGAGKSVLLLTKDG